MVQYPASPPFQDEQPAPLPAISSAPPNGFPLSIVFVPVAGAIAICILALIIAGVLTSIFWEPTGTDGDGLAIIALFFLTLVMVGPMAFGALFVWMMRRNDRDKPRVTGTVAALGLLPALIIGAWSIAFYAQNRGLRTTGLVTALALVVLALIWVLAVIDRQRFRTAVMGTIVGGLVVAFTLTAANLNADAHDRSLERQAISAENAPLALFDSRGALSERDGWNITQVDTIVFDRSYRYGRLGLRLENRSGQTVSVKFASTEAGGHCSQTTACRPLLTLENGTIIHGDPDSFGSSFDFPAPRGQGWWIVSTSASLSARELSEVVDLLQLVTVDQWMAAQSRFRD